MPDSSRSLTWRSTPLKIQGKHFRTIWTEGDAVKIIDQRLLPFRVAVDEVPSAAAMAKAIRDMAVRGAPLIGAAAGFGAYLAAREIHAKENLLEKKGRARFLSEMENLREARPTAVNLAWAVDRQLMKLESIGASKDPVGELKAEAQRIADEDVEICESMGKHGLPLIQEIAKKKKGTPVNIMTHCNAGWLATVDYGTATSAIYQAHRMGIPLHVYVSETRPRLQGARLTAFELREEGIPYTVIVDNACGHLLQRGKVDLCIVGTDRTTSTGDVANKVGTYLKALAAKAHNVPFYVAAPSSSIDWNLTDGISGIPIEERSGTEVTRVSGKGDRRQEELEVEICAPNSGTQNFGFDVTPAALVTALITERGVSEANAKGLKKLFPEKGPRS